jgi:hypothetical protein
VIWRTDVFWQHFFTDTPGFDGFRPAVENDVFVLSVKTGLAQNLGQKTAQFPTPYF